jgi:hypothetical protein
MLAAAASATPHTVTAEDEGEDAEPPPTPTEAEIKAVFAQNEIVWTDEEETVLQGTANTDVDAVWKILDHMGVDYVVLYVPDRTYTLKRQIFGAKVLVMRTEMPGGGEDDNHDGDTGGGGAVDEALAQDKMALEAAEAAVEEVSVH